MAETQENKEMPGGLSAAGLALLVISLLLVGNAMLYYFVVLPFGQIYRISQAIQYAMITATTATSLLVFFFMWWKQNTNPKEQLDLGLDEEKPQVKTDNPVRETEILLNEIDYNISTKNYGKVTQLHNQLLDTLRKVPERKKQSAKSRIDSVEKKIADLKEKGLI